ncbi:MAG: FkbM family methyltransferase [Parvibaculum sp.]|uniref:FkbM family methyltransferase n=1 Tax=Parvibaculum sp. TaxID=2024848 RepID=UPI00272EE8AF|nr:FkbM family methyltransferase [Parvibaculum sp.]MDP2151620.1 FkbM family methyltransferase [Parvibaculum sp.]
MRFGFPLKEKIAFYWVYFASKVFCLWFEVKRPKLRMFIYEILYSAYKFIDRNSLLPSPFKTDYVETKFGKFRVRPGTVDMTNASPAFERRDVDYLLGLVSGLAARQRRILFLDIGADIGTFAVTVGNRFKGYEGLHIMAFEPAESSFGLLTHNVNLNGLSPKVQLCNFALFSEDGRELEFQFNIGAPGSSGLRFAAQAGFETQRVTARTLDAVLKDRASDYDDIIFKMDVEGVESEVLKGSQQALDSGRDIYLLIEDFVNPEIITYLEGMGAEFMAKLTPYNSFWRYRKPVNPR